MSDNDIKSMDQRLPPESKRSEPDQTYTVRELIKTLVDAEDPDQIVHIRVFNGDPIPITGVNFEEDLVVFDGTV